MLNVFRLFSPKRTPSTKSDLATLSSPGSLSPPHSDDGTSNQASYLSLLMADYHHHQTLKDHRFDTIITLAGIGYTTAVAITTLVSTGNLDLPPEVFWLAPLSFVLLFAIIVQWFYRVLLHSYYLRDLEEEISQQLSDEMEFRTFHFENTETRALFSAKTGMASVLLTYVLLYIVALAVYLGLVVVSYRMLVEDEAPAGALVSFIVANVLLGILMTATAIPLFRGFKSVYLRWIDKPSNAEVSATERSGTMLLVRYSIMPRPFDLVFKSTCTWGAILVTILLLKVDFSWTNPSTWDILILPLLVYLNVDFLAKQATYIWNEIRDFDRDRRHPDKANRPLPRLGPRAIPPAKVMFLVRFIGAFAVSILLWQRFSLWWLPIVTGLVFGVQVVYDVVAKPASGPWRWGVATVGYSLRWVSGSLAVIAAVAQYDLPVQFLIPLWAVYFLPTVIYLTLWGTVFAAIFLASYWWSESEYLVRQRADGPADTDGVDEWFLNTSNSVRRACSIALFPLTGWIVGNYLDATYSEQLVMLAALVIAGPVLMACCWFLLATAQDSSTDARSPEPNQARANMRLIIMVIIAVFLLLALYLTHVHRWIATGGMVAFTLSLFIYVLYEQNQYEFLMLKTLKRDLMGVIVALDRVIFGAGGRGVDLGHKVSQGAED